MLLPYPGTKRLAAPRLAREIRRLARATGPCEYREPFFGGGAVGLALLAEPGPHIHGAWLNDLDLDTAAVWNAVVERPDSLVELLHRICPSQDLYSSARDYLLRRPAPEDYELLALAKLIVQRASSHSRGLRTITASTAIRHRLSPASLAEKIRRENRVLLAFPLRHGGITSLDFEQVAAHPGRAVLYLDPPYYRQGKQFYRQEFTLSDHCRLATTLRRTDHHWLMSYDDHPEVRRLYEWATVTTVEVPYGRRVNRELLIYSPGCH